MSLRMSPAGSGAGEGSLRDLAILGRYEVLQTGKLSDVPRNQTMRILAPKPADVEYDASFTVGTSGYGNTGVAIVHVRVGLAAYRILLPIILNAAGSEPIVTVTWTATAQPMPSATPTTTSLPLSTATPTATQQSVPTTTPLPTPPFSFTATPTTIPSAWQTIFSDGFDGGFPGA